MTEETLVKEINGEVLTSSRDVAEKFNKEHRNVTRDIRKIIDDLGGAQNCAHLFKESEHTNEQNKQVYSEYLMTRDGFSLLAMGFTGSKALQWKLKYIEAFNKMEETIHKVLNAKDTAILSIINAGGDVERALAISNFEKVIVTPLEKVIEEQKPFADFAKQVTKADNTIDMGEMAKLLHEKNNIDVGRNRLFEILRNNKILMSNNSPYQQYIERNWFKLIETTKETSYGTKVFTKVLVTGLGQLKVTDLILSYTNKELATV